MTNQPGSDARGVRPLIVLVVAVLLLAAGCTSDAATTTPDPSTPVPTTSVPVTPEPDPTTADELRRQQEDALRQDPSYADAVRLALTQFAAGENLAIEEIPLENRVALGLGRDIDRVEDKETLRDQQQWTIDRPEGYAEFTGPFSALDVLTRFETQVSVGEHPHCVGEPLARPDGFEHHVQVSIQPAEGQVDSCIVWFAVDLFLDPNTLAISAVTLALFGP